MPGAYEKYLEWYKSERQVTLRLKTGPYHLLGHFGKDLIVETMNEPRLARMNAATLPGCSTIHWGKAHERFQVSRRTQARFNGFSFEKLHNEHLEFFLCVAVGEGAAVSTLRLHDITEIMGKPKISKTCSSSMNLGSLKRLELNMSASLALTGDCDNFLPWLSMLANLEALKFVQRWYEQPNIDVLGAFYPHHYPQLRWMHLENVRTDWEALWDFLLKHHQRLVHVKVVNPDCMPSIWSPVRTGLEDSTVFAKLQTGKSLTDPIFVIHGQGGHRKTKKQHNSCLNP